MRRKLSVGEMRYILTNPDQYMVEELCEMFDLTHADFLKLMEHAPDEDTNVAYGVDHEQWGDVDYDEYMNETYV